MKRTTLLAILQQSEYNFNRFKTWYHRHQDQDLRVEPEQWTPKLKLIQTLVQLLFWLPLLWRYQVALLLTQPGEQAIRRQTYAKARAKLKRLRTHGLTVVAIAGSYGKTSTKHILYHTLNSQLPSLMTPKSVNTMLGISQIILKDLQPTHKVFICELGEFNPGDLRELTEFIAPDFGILTPIGHQHLELLGSFEQVVKEFQMYADYFSAPDNLLVAEQNQAYLKKTNNLKWYGQTSSSQLQVSSVFVTRAGTEYQAIINQHETLKVFTPLFGEHQAVNSLPAFWLGQRLGLASTTMAKAMSTMPYIERRHEPTFAEPNILILDNSYNTNPDSVQESLKLLNQLRASNRIMITAGFVEQGSEAEQNHLRFGQQLATQVDYLGLFNAPYAAEITKGFVEAGGQADHIARGTSQTEVTQKLQAHITPGSVIIYEGGFQELHT